MPSSPLHTLLVPVADEADAQQTCTALEPYGPAIESLIALHVPPPGTEERANGLFDPFEATFGEESSGPALTTEVHPQDDPIAGIASAAETTDVTAIGVLPRPRSRFLQILSKENTTSLVSSTDVPVFVLPQETNGKDVPTEEPFVSPPWEPSILVPLTDEPHAFEALEYACTVFSNPSIAAVHVLEPPSVDIYSTMTPGVSSESSTAEAERQEAVDAMFDRAKKIAGEHGVTVTTLAISGDVAPTLTDYLDTNPMDLIVLGVPGGITPDRRQLGSTVKGLIWNAQVPTVIH